MKVHWKGVGDAWVFFFLAGGVILKGPNPLSELDLVQKGAERERERYGVKSIYKKPHGRQDIT